MASVLRPPALLLGSTFAVHLLAVRYQRRLDDGETGGAATVAVRSYLSQLGDSLVPDNGVIEALGRTALLAAAAAVAGLAIGWLWITIRYRLDRNRGTIERPVSGIWTGLLLAITVPGLSWLPLSRWAVDQGLVPEGPLPALDAGLESYRSIALWSILIGLAITPTVAAALSGGRSWTAIAAGGHPALAPLAARPSSRPRWRVGLPTLTFGLTLALAEVVAGTGGLIDRFVAAMQDGRPDDLLPLATPLVLAGALLAPLTDIGAAVLRRVERPRVPGSDQARPARRSTVLALGLGGLMVAAAIIGAMAGPDPEATAETLRGPSLDGPWLGTDAVGRSVAARTGAALAVTLAASAVPATVATVVGAGLALLRRSPNWTVAGLVGGLIDLFSWPAALVVPLAIWPATVDGRPALDLVAIQVTALLLVPAATRLLARPLVARSQRWARLAAIWCLLTAAALSIQLFARFVAAADGTGWPTLGGLAAAGMETYEASSWPVLAPLLAAIAAGTALYWLADALTTVGLRRTEPADEPAPGSSSAHLERVVMALRPNPTRPHTPPVDDETEPPRITLADDAAPTSRPEHPAITLGTPGHAERGDVDDSTGDHARPEDIEHDPVDIRHELSVASALDVAPPDDETSIEDEASQTIELRPSDLRRAGLHPDQPRPG